MPNPGMTKVFLAIRAGLGELGAEYLYGAKPSLEAAHIGKTDCSGFIRWIVGKAGLRIPGFDGSVHQYELCRDIPVATARGSIGCFLFIKPKGGKPGHVAMSLGHDFTLEARGSEGVTIVKPAENRKRKWDRAGKLPQLFEPI